MKGFQFFPGLFNYFTQIGFGKDCRCGQIRKIKYSNIIRPAKIIYLELKKTESNVGYKYYDDEFTYSSGILPLANCF